VGLIIAQNEKTGEAMTDNNDFTDHLKAGLQQMKAQEKQRRARYTAKDFGYVLGKWWRQMGIQPMVQEIQYAQVIESLGWLLREVQLEKKNEIFDEQGFRDGVKEGLEIPRG